MIDWEICDFDFDIKDIRLPQSDQDIEFSEI